MKIFTTLPKRTIIITENQKRLVSVLQEGGRKHYHVNMDASIIKKDGRTAPKMTIGDFKNKLDSITSRYREEKTMKPSNFLYSFCRYPDPKEHPFMGQFKKDMEKIHVDGENCEMIGDVRQTTTGIPYILAYKGGDWESPVCFIVYWDGKNIRGYIPEYGNAIDRKRKEAFGNDDEKDLEYVKGQLGDDYKGVRPGEDIYYDKDACIKDFTQHVKVKGKVSESVHRMPRTLNEDGEVKFKPTSEWMRQKYDEMNQLLFNGKLGDCTLQPFTSGKGANGRTLGRFRIMGAGIKADRRDRKMYTEDILGIRRTYVGRDNFVLICEPCIELNAHYSATEEAWLNTLVHEMCHYYTYMDGWVPRQGHGVEFRNIGYAVSERSNGRFTIQRLASAEQMTNMELDSDIQAKNAAKAERKDNNTMIIIVVKTNGDVRLILTTLQKVLDEVEAVHSNRGDAKYIGYVKDTELLNMMRSVGYKSLSRTYRFWTITNKPFLGQLIGFNWKKVYGDCGTLAEALGKKDESPNKSERSEYRLGYRIIRDGDKYNLVDEKGHKIFGNHPADKIWLNDEGNAYCFQKGKFAFVGMPGHWERMEINENTKHGMKRRNLSEDTVEEVNQGGGADTITIDSGMNLGLESPLEMIGQ